MTEIITSADMPTTVLELLTAIKQRPAMYLGRRYISCLKSYLDAWCSLAYQHNIAIGANCLVDFQTWIVSKYHITNSHSWADIILFYSGDECDALDEFFKLFAEWQQEIAEA